MTHHDLTISWGVIALACFSSPGFASTSGDPRAKAFLKLIERPRVPLAAESRVASESNDLRVERFSYAAEAKQRVPGILVRKKSSAVKAPAVIILHGTGGNKDSQENFLKELASQGFAAVAIDGRYHGERAKPGARSTEYVDAILRAYREGREHPFLYDTVWDVMRLIDYLETRPDVDATRIGVIGFSKGGMETYLAAAVDSRIQVAIPCIGVQSFRWALDNNSWHSRVGTFQAAVNGAAADDGAAVDAQFIRRFYDRVAPGVYTDYDGPAMVPLIAPRPMLVINGDSDARTPKPGLMECVDAARSAYKKAGAEEKFEFLLQPNTGHKVNPDALHSAVEFFVRWLHPSAVNTSN